MTGHSKALAQRTVTGVVAGMVVAVAAATGVGFWLSYDGLHAFALHAGVSGPEAWAWPASVDLFIAAGEAGVTISALRRHKDRAAWAYLAVGFAASVTANVLHVDPAALHWTHYAAAAVPPIAAMLALAALMRQTYQLAVDRHVATQRAATSAQKAATSAQKADGDRSRRQPPARTAKLPLATLSDQAVRSALATDPDMTTGQLAAMTGLSDRTVRRVKARLNGAAAA
ncbi:MAG TPA: DUF2637 domain-containing protein [Streptosporangiaceae bacterium]|nr:DUF2637 domain-containing protein [Streptosporangiaceae bacterium]